MVVRTERFTGAFRRFVDRLPKARSATRVHTLEESIISPSIQQKVQQAILRQFSSSGYPGHIYTTREDGGFSLLPPEVVTAHIVSAELKYARRLVQLAQTIPESDRRREVIHLAHIHRKKAVDTWKENRKVLNSASDTGSQSTAEDGMDKQAA